MTCFKVAIHISNHSVEEGDRGIVVVGGSMHLGEMFGEGSADSSATGEVEEDIIQAELEAEREEEVHQKSFGERVQFWLQPFAFDTIVFSDTGRIIEFVPLVDLSHELGHQDNSFCW